MFLASNMLPLSLVESRSFKEMCKRFCGNYEVPSRYIITEQIKLYYEDVVIHLKDELSKCCYASMTTDAWSSINQTSFITTTVVYIKDGDFHSHVLQTRSYYVS